MAEVVGSLKGTSAIAVARQFGSRQRHGNGETFWARGYAVSTVGCAAEPMRRSIRTPEQLEAPGRDEDGDVSESLRTCIWQPLGLLTTVKPPALRERHDSHWPASHSDFCPSINNRMGWSALGLRRATSCCSQPKVSSVADATWSSRS